jgi:hypothetical protein
VNRQYAATDPLKSVYLCSSQRAESIVAESQFTSFPQYRAPLVNRPTPHSVFDSSSRRDVNLECGNTKVELNCECNCGLNGEWCLPRPCQPCHHVCNIRLCHMSMGPNLLHPLLGDDRTQHVDHSEDAR